MGRRRIAPRNSDRVAAYSVSAVCKLCGQHFDDFDHYCKHLRQHFEDDPDREWRVCNEDDCRNNKSSCDTNFMYHLSAKHGYDKAFQCDRCSKEFALVYDVMKHSKCKLTES